MSKRARPVDSCDCFINGLLALWGVCALGMVGLIGGLLYAQRMGWIQ